MSSQIETIADIVSKHEVRIAALEKRDGALPPAVARVVECAVAWRGARDQYVHSGDSESFAKQSRALDAAVAAYQETLR